MIAILPVEALAYSFHVRPDSSIPHMEDQFENYFEFLNGWTPRLIVYFVIKLCLIALAFLVLFRKRKRI